MAGLHDRVERGIAIARSPDDIEQVTESIFSVRSQDGKGVYLVTLEGGRAKCICPDFVAHNLPCKHVLAVQFKQKGLTPLEAAEVEAKRPRPTYRQNWTAYNGGQRAELAMFDEVLLELVQGIQDPNPEKPTGRPRIPFDDLVYCAVEKVYQGLPLRVGHGLQDRLQAEGRIGSSPSRNMTSALLQRVDLTPVLTALVAKSALPLASLERTFAVDSSGFRTNSFGDYCREKYGARVHNTWVKASILIGTKTHIIPAVILSDGHAADCPQFPGLVDGAVAAGFVLNEVYADKGYLSAENFEAVGRAGGTPYIMFKQNSRGSRRGGGPKALGHSPLWKRMWHLFHADPTTYLAHYHGRSNVESVFAAIKKKLGETLRSKNPVAQRNELLCKILAYNITVLIHEAFEHGIPIPGAVAVPAPTASRPPDRIELTPLVRPVDVPAPRTVDWSGVDN